MSTDGYVEDDGPVVRAYALTRGRVAATLDLLAVVGVTGALPGPRANLSREHRRLLGLVELGPRPVVDVASDSGLPVGVVRILLGDLVEERLIKVRPRTANVSEGILREVISGLQAL
ncbi:DUF742 domain-containing protein [Streptosporangiaceae bacterium NEAU-GS5]|nr:DUF742 domain-containing protein [Streptosporangiaceae bacterium NEAU-GS5]